MAQNTFINVTADKSSASRTIPNSHAHEARGGTAAAADLTISFDSAVIASLATYDTCMAAARARAIAGGLK